MKRRGFLRFLGLGAMGVAAMGVGGATWLKRAPKANKYYTGPVSDHFDGTYFYNSSTDPESRFGELLKWRFTEKRAEWPDSFPSGFETAVPMPSVNGDALRVTMIGHASLLIQTNGLNIITDPVFSDRASPLRFLGPKRRNPPGVAFDALPRIDLVLLSHNHYDHLDLATLARLVARDNPTIITPLGNDAIIQGEIANALVQTGDWGDAVAVNDTTTIHFEPCHHWSARGMKDRRMALWAAFVIETPAAKVYHIGDTGFNDGQHFAAAAEKHGEFDLTIMPIGAYEPRWFMKGAHQNPAEAVEGFKLCNTRHALGHHWGTFQLTDEAVDAPPKALAEALTKAEIAHDRFLAMAPGQVWSNESLS